MADQLPPRIAQRFVPFGNSIFAEMTALAIKHGAVNLSQGFPDFDGPAVAKQGAIDAINAGHGQYARMQGVPLLNKAIAQSWAKRGYGEVDPDACVTVTSGCSEAIVCVALGLLNPGDEIILFEPYFDFYTAAAAMAGAVPRFVALRPPADENGSFTFDEGELRRAFTPKTKAILINSPHNPTGKVFTREELSLIASLCVKHGVIAITDEVYEHLTYEPGLPHIPIATLPGMADLTVTLSSMGKSYSLTGWKVGWAIAPPHLTAGVRSAKQFITFSTATPLQHGAAQVITSPGNSIEELRALYIRNRDRLRSALHAVGLKVFPSHGTYFLMADHSALRLGDDRAFCRFLTEKVGVAAIPPSVFYDHPALGRNLVRFAYCKKTETMDEAIRRLATLGRG
jgi:aspartate/methionine/tyrosine aminotransferase